MPDVRWVWQRAPGGPGALLSTAIRGGPCTPAGSREGGASCRRGWAHSGSLFSLQVMYFSSLFPYVVLACFLVRGLLLRGAIDGILHMFTPKVRVTGSWGTRTALLGLICFMQCNTH